MATRNSHSTGLRESSFMSRMTFQIPTALKTAWKIFWRRGPLKVVYLTLGLTLVILYRESARNPWLHLSFATEHNSQSRSLTSSGKLLFHRIRKHSQINIYQQLHGNVLVLCFEEIKMIHVISFKNWELEQDLYHVNDCTWTLSIFLEWERCLNQAPEHTI